MKEAEFKKKWISEKPIYKAWGKYIQNTITEALADQGKDLDIFLKTPAHYRLKTDESIIDKAFNRGKNYRDPYNDIEDKVGLRFVVLLLEDIKVISDIITKHSAWKFDACKDFQKEKDDNPLLFTYQSQHYILRPAIDIEFDGVTIPPSTPCEVQIRTLLQHAHAELTHDAIYKAKRAIQPKVHRTVAKSMALIETTDDFFTEVTHDLNYGPLQEYQIIERLDSIYLTLTDLHPFNQKSGIVIWDTFERFINDDLIGKIQEFLKKYPIIKTCIQNKYGENVFYQQSTVLFVYWMIKYRTNGLLRDWPLPKSVLQPLANDLGVNL